LVTVICPFAPVSIRTGTKPIVSGALTVALRVPDVFSAAVFAVGTFVRVLDTGTARPVAVIVGSVDEIEPVAVGAALLFISTGENTALPATVGPFTAVSGTPAPVLVVRAAVAGVVAPAMTGVGPLTGVGATPPPPAAVVAPAAASVTPPPVVPLVMTGTGTELIEELTVA
jgi:hypothetical protein